MSKATPYLTPTPALLDGWSGEADVYVGPDTGWIPAAILRGHPVFTLHAGLPKRLDARRPEVAHRIVDVARASGADLTWMLPTALGGTLRDAEESAAVLVRDREIVAAGGVGIVGIAPCWAHQRGASYRLAGCEWITKVDDAGWVFAQDFDTHITGPETGDAGRAAADAAALSAGFTLRNPDHPLTLPEVPRV